MACASAQTITPRSIATSLWGHPASRVIALHPSILKQQAESKAVEALVGGTLTTLTEPHLAAARPRHEMFSKRYQHFVGRYDWATF